MRTFDITMVVDTRMRGADARTWHACLHSLAEHGYRVGIMPIFGPLTQPHGILEPSLQPFIDRHKKLTVIDPPDTVSCHLFFGYHIACFLHQINRPCHVQADHGILRVDQPLSTRDGRKLVDIAALMNNAQEFMGLMPILAPNDPVVRADLVDLGHGNNVTADDWPPVVKAGFFSQDESRSLNRADGAPWTLGRHAADRPSCWPSRQDALSTILTPGEGWSFKLMDCGPLPAIDQAHIEFRSSVDHQRSIGDQKPEAFLHGLDAYPTTIRDGLRPYIDTALAEALAAGLPIIAPRSFASLIGTAGLLVDDTDWASSYRNLTKASLLAASEAARELAKQFASNTLQERLSPYLKAPAAATNTLTLQRDFRCPARVLFITPNGIGMGHLTRALAIARRLEPWLEPVFLTMSQGAGIIDDFGFVVEYTPYFNSYGGTDESWQSGFQAKLEQMIGFYDPRVILFDGNVPYQSLTKICRSHRERFFIWCRRGMWRKQVPHHYVERSDAFDVVIEPEDLAQSYDVGPTVARRDEVLQVPPITLLDHTEIEPRLSARQTLGLPSEGDAVLIMTGSGNNFDMSWITDIVRGTLGQRDGLTIRRAKWMIDYERSPDGDIDIEGYPFARYFNAFDFAVSAVGYNSFHELLKARLPAIFVPNENPTMDDQEARAIWAERAKIGYCVRAADKFRMSWALKKLIDSKNRQKMRTRIDALPNDNGALVIAELIRDLALCRRADHPDLHRAIRLPRD